MLWSAPSALAKHSTIDWYGTGPTAIACSIQHWYLLAIISVLGCARVCDGNPP